MEQSRYWKQFRYQFVRFKIIPSDADIGIEGITEELNIDNYHSHTVSILPVEAIKLVLFQYHLRLKTYL